VLRSGYGTVEIGRNDLEVERARRVRPVKVRPVASARTTDARVVGVHADALGARRTRSRSDVPWRFLEAQGFAGKVGDCVAAPAADGTSVLHVGLGPKVAVDTGVLRSVAAVAARAAGRARTLTIDVTGASADLDDEAVLRSLAEGAALGGYRWETYRSEPVRARLTEVQLVAPSGTVNRQVRDAVTAGLRTADAANFARDLVNEPGGMLTAPEFAARVAIAASAGGVACTVYDEDAIRALGFGGLLAVNRGSTIPPRVVEVVHEPDGADDSTPTVALVGKGITFDSGGYSIKTADGMTTMKSDMGGGAAVVAATCAARDLGVPTRIRTIVPLTDNMIGGDAQRVGDVITHYGGTTSEVLNTDAEGRLVLADVLSWVGQPHEGGRRPDAIIDLATLTGACVVGLGTRTAGLWATGDGLADAVLAAARAANEKVWRMPLVEELRKDLESKVADRKNVGGRYGGAITAALFLRDFVDGALPWAHLDIAGPAFNEGGDELEIPAGGTGFGVRTLLDLLGTWGLDGRAAVEST
jgi:leucyl aminopeptidase